MRRFHQVTAALAATAATLALAGPAGAAATTADTAERASRTTGAERMPAPTAQKNRPTPFALTSWGYGTKVSGGQLPAAVGSTAFDVISCTNETGIRKTEEIVDVELPGLGDIGVGKTELWTARKDGAVHVYSKHRVVGLTLMESSIGKLELGGVASLSHVWHDAQGFHSEVDTNIGALTFTPAGGEPQSFPLPGPGQPIEIPGLAEIWLGHGVHKATRDGARAFGNALRIKFLPTGSQINVAHTSVSMQDGITQGILGGHASGIDATALDGVVKIGKTPLTILPCRGTEGEEVGKSLVDLGPAGSPLDGVLEVGVLKTSAFGKQTAQRTWGWTQAELASINLGDGQVIIRGIKARANVERTRTGKVKATAEGSSIGEFVMNGEPQAIPDPGQPIEIPGLAKIEFNVVEKPRRNVVTVTALRVTLLDGTALVLNIGQAKAKIDPSGL